MGAEVLIRGKGTLPLMGLVRLEKPGKPVTVYLEGDGRAWLTPGRPSPDPTPRHPVALKLARVDPSPNVAWLARPCQYQMLQAPGDCEARHWTHARYGGEILDVINEALDSVAAGNNGGLHLVGHSGGGAIAALLAARRDDVLSLRTVAGNLDHRTFTDYHGVTPMHASLNPAARAQALEDIPQIHFSGTGDTVVVPEVIEAFRNAMADERCVRRQTVEADHRDGWEEAWPSLLEERPVCESP